MWYNHFTWSPVPPISGSKQYLSISWSLTNDHKFLFIQESPCFVVVPVQVTRSPPGKCPAMVSYFVYQHLSVHTKYCAGAFQLCSSSFFLSLYRPQNSLSGLILFFFYSHSCGFLGARGGAVGWGTALQAGRSRVRFTMVSLESVIDTKPPAALWPWGWLRLQQKWVPGIYPGGKGGRCVWLTTVPTSCADWLEIWEPQLPGTLRACPGL